MNFKRLISVVLLFIMIFSFSGCGSTENTEKSIEETVTEMQKEENTVVGVWSVEKYVVYDGPIKSQCEQMCKEWYYTGAEYEFTLESFKACFDESLVTNYKIIDDKQMEIFTLANESMIYDYELTDDNLVLHNNYTGDLQSLGHCLSIYFKRK